MTKRRMIHDCIWQSEGVARLDFRQRLLWIGLITTADDQGRGRAHPGLIRAAVFPYDIIALDDIATDLQTIVDLGMALVYQVEGKLYYQVIHWWDYQTPQWVGPSDYPAPDGWLDRLRHHGKGHVIITENWPNTSDKAANDKADLSPDKSAFERGKGKGKGKGKEEGKERETLSSASADYQAIRQAWAELFPDKPQPRTDNKTLQGKVKTRLGSEHFRDNWRDALKRAARGSFCHEGKFFDLAWFLYNDNNYEKCLNGNYDDTKARGRPAADNGAFVWDGSDPVEL